MKTTKCAACEAAIFWALIRKLDQTVAAKPRPIDAAPSPRGNLVLVGGGEDRPLLRTMSADEVAAPADEDRYLSHFATCTQPEKFRRAGTSTRFTRSRSRSGGRR